MSSSEDRALRELAQAHGLEVSSYLRTAGMGRDFPPVSRVPEVTRDTVVNLSHAGANLNQIARRLNTDHPNDQVTHEEILEALIVLSAAIRQLQVEVLRPPDEAAS